MGWRKISGRQVAAKCQKAEVVMEDYKLVARTEHFGINTKLWLFKYPSMKNAKKANACLHVKNFFFYHLLTEINGPCPSLMNVSHSKQFNNTFWTI